MAFSVHLYADDTQIYIMFNPDDTVNAISRIEVCVAWMVTNKPMLNGDKTVIIVFSAPHHISCDVHHIHIDVHEDRSNYRYC